MARITVEDCLEHVSNRFALVVLAGKRAKQLLSGSPVLIDERRDNKEIVTSLREIAAGKVKFDESVAIEDEASEQIETSPEVPTSSIGDDLFKDPAPAEAAEADSEEKEEVVETSAA